MQPKKDRKPDRSCRCILFKIEKNWSYKPVLTGFRSGSGSGPKVPNLNRTGLRGGDFGTEEAVVDLAKDFGGIMKQ